jgi:predicted amidohydrolase YtcJ
MMTEQILAVRAGKIRTLDAVRPEVESLAMRDGRVAAIGTAEEIESFVGAGARWLDLRPYTVVPGLTDSHIHLVEWALGLTGHNVADAGSMAGVLERVAKAAKVADERDWLEFKGWDPAWRDQADLADLDKASHGRAVALVAHDLHSGWLNTQTMRRLGITADQEDPPGGTVERDTDGLPTGVVTEHALDWWYQGRPRAGAGERRAALRRGQAELHRLGMTAVQSVEAPEAFRIVEDLLRADELRLRVLHHMPQRFLDALIDCGMRSGFGNEWLRIGGIKYFTDGALGSRTAWMLDPYEGSSERGIRRLEPDELKVDVERAVMAGLAATIHAIGDAAVRMTLDVLERAGAHGLAIPHRIEHLQCFHPSDMSRAAELGITASMQPSHLLTDVRLAEDRWGVDRSSRTMALRSLLDAGTVLALGSDAPVEAADPREGFFGAMARRDRGGYPDEGFFPEQRLSGQEVLEGYTVGAAKAAGEADRRGRLSPGFLADFAAWDVDLVSAEPEEILEAGVATTVVGGEVVYEK